MRDVGDRRPDLDALGGASRGTSPYSQRAVAEAVAEPERRRRRVAGVVAAVADERALGVLQLAVGRASPTTPGAAPSAAGNVVTSRPAGSMSPSSAAATAWPPSWPGRPAQSTASTSSSHGISTGVAALTTTTVRGRARRRRLRPARPARRAARRVVLSTASVSCSSVRPTTTTATSAPLGRADGLGHHVGDRTRRRAGDQAEPPGNRLPGWRSRPRPRIAVRSRRSMVVRAGGRRSSSPESAPGAAQVDPVRLVPRPARPVADAQRAELDRAATADARPAARARVGGRRGRRRSRQRDRRGGTCASVSSVPSAANSVTRTPGSPVAGSDQEAPRPARGGPHLDAVDHGRPGRRAGRRARRPR